MGLKNPYHPYNKMSAYTVNDDDSFFDEKTIVCLQKLNRIFQLRLITLYSYKKRETYDNKQMFEKENSVTTDTFLSWSLGFFL